MEREVDPFVRVAVLVHDINNALTIIDANADFLLTAVPVAPTEATECIAEVRDAARRAALIVKELLQISRAERARAASEDAYRVSSPSRPRASSE